MAKEPKIFCSYSKLVPIGEVKPNPRNPNTHPDSQIKLLAKVIQNQGWRCPITVSNLSGMVVRGHGRLMAAKLLGCAKVPVDFQDYESPEMEMADLIADNRIAELAEIDLPTLKDLLQELDTGDLDMELTGFDDAGMENIMTEFYINNGGLPEIDSFYKDNEYVGETMPEEKKCPTCGRKLKLGTKLKPQKSQPKI